MLGRVKHTAMVLLLLSFPVNPDERRRTFRRSTAYAALLIATGAFTIYVGFDRLSRHESQYAIVTWLFATVALLLAARFTIAALRSRPPSN